MIRCPNCKDLIDLEDIPSIQGLDLLNPAQVVELCLLWKKEIGPMMVKAKMALEVPKVRDWFQKIIPKRTIHALTIEVGRILSQLVTDPRLDAERAGFFFKNCGRGFYSLSWKD